MSSGRPRPDQSGEHRIDVELHALAPGLRKAAPRAVEPQPKSPAHAELLTVFRALLRHGFTQRAIARRLGVSHSFVIDLRRGARSARSAGNDWVLRMWDLLGSVETADSRSGTEG